MLIHCDYLGFSGDAVKIIIDVITEHRTDFIRKLLGIHKEYYVVEGTVVYGFLFVIGSDIGWDSIW